MNNTQQPMKMHTTLTSTEEFPASRSQYPSILHGMDISAQGKLLTDSCSESNQSRPDNNEAEMGPPRPRRKSRKRNTSEIDRVTIKNSYTSGLSTFEIARRYGFTHKQIYYALRNSSKPKTRGKRRKSAFPQDKPIEFISWIYREPNKRREPNLFSPDMTTQLELQGHEKKPTRTTIDSQGLGEQSRSVCKTG